MAYIDRRGAFVEGVAIKSPCRVATTASIALNGLQQIDGVNLVEGDRVLVKNQNDATTNGIYNASSGDWTRAVDADANYDFVEGSFIHVNEGTTLGGGDFVCTTSGDIVIGTSELMFGSSGSGTSFTGEVGFFDSIVAATQANIPSSATTVILNGYAAAGDRGGASYKRVGAPPSHGGKFQSADGAWWEISSIVLDVRMFGAVPNNTGDYRVQLQTAADAGIALGRQVNFHVENLPFRTSGAIKFDTGARWHANGGFYSTGQQIFKLTDTAQVDVNIIEPRLFDGTITDAKFLGIWNINGNIATRIGNGTVTTLGADRPGSSGFCSGGAKKITIERMWAGDIVTHGIDFTAGGWVDPDTGTRYLINPDDAAPDFYPDNMSSEIKFDWIGAHNCGDDGVTGHFTHGVRGNKVIVTSCGMRQTGLASNPFEPDDGVFDWKIEYVEGHGGNRGVAIKSHTPLAAPYGICIGTAVLVGCIRGAYFYDPNNETWDRGNRIGTLIVLDPVKVQSSIAVPGNSGALYVDAMAGVVVDTTYARAQGDEAVDWGPVVSFVSGAIKPKAGRIIAENWNPSEAANALNAVLQVSSSVVGYEVGRIDAKNCGWRVVADTGSVNPYIGFVRAELPTPIANSIAVRMTAHPSVSGGYIGPLALAGFATATSYNTDTDSVGKSFAQRHDFLLPSAQGKEVFSYDAYKSISSTVDFNTLLTPGFYVTLGATYTNGPLGSGTHTGALEVFGRTATSTQIHQLWFDYNTGDIWTRGKTSLDVWSAWVNLRATAAALMTTRGDLVRRGASVPERFALGVVGQVLRSDGTDVVWSDHLVPMQWSSEFVENKTYGIVLNLPYKATITKVTSKCASGTCTATVKINGTPLGGTANAVSSSEQDQAQASANVANVGDDITVEITSNSNALDVQLMISAKRS